MKVLVDTPIWSLVLRKATRRIPSDEHLESRFIELLNEFRVEMIGPIRQELLSGISSETAYQKLKLKLETFEDLAIETEDYTRAAEIHNICRKKGVQGSHIDFLICAVAMRYQLSIFTTDKDFQHYAKHIPIVLF